jgi:hypothetical protein
LHVSLLAEDIVSDGNIELRLMMYDDSPVGPQTVAWDDVTFTVTEPDGGATVFSLTEDFEAGLDAWTALSHPEDRPDLGDPWGVGNRVCVLTDDQFDDPAWDFDQGGLGNGFREDLWPGDPWDEWGASWAYNGVWQHDVLIERSITTVTGNIEFRLLLHDKHEGKQAVAWDNILLTITPDLVCPNAGGTAERDVRYDADTDGDVDQEDFAVLQLCYTGADDPGGVYDFEACRCMNSDGATEDPLDIDASDVAAFQACGSAPGVAATAACDDGLDPP